MDIFNTDKPCAQCGKMMHNVYPKRMYCESCNKERGIERQQAYRERLRKQRENAAPQIKVALNVVDKYCSDCRYVCKETPDTWDWMRTYYLKTGIRRPCKAGKGCTVKHTRKKGG